MGIYAFMQSVFIFSNWERWPDEETWYFLREMPLDCKLRGIQLWEPNPPKVKKFYSMVPNPTDKEIIEMWVGHEWW